MKKLILVALILQLVIIIRSSSPANKKSKHHYEFGDILVFPRKCTGNEGKPLYNHYAVYVGPQSEENVGQGDNNIVQRTRTGEPSCQFAQLAKVREGYAEQVYNYLDGVEKDGGGRYTPGTPEEMKARIIHLLKNCRKYNLLSNNCEHFATKVRYNIGMTMQVGAKCEGFVVRSKKAKKLLARIKQKMPHLVKCEKISSCPVCSLFTRSPV